MTDPLRTPFYEQHLALKAKMVEFGGWEMPLMYPDGIVREHLNTRRGAGLFDVSHMGRFRIRGKEALSFLQHVLTNNAAALDIQTTGAQYTLIPTETGGAVDDAYLYRFKKDEFLLVVNAANREKDWQHLQALMADFHEIEMIDQTAETAMLSLQGPESRRILKNILSEGELPEPRRNCVGTGSISGTNVLLARTGYTGEPICFELFMAGSHGPEIWQRLLDEGATPVGLGARDTLRLEAGLPLYGHELGIDPDGREIPILACPISKPAVSFSPLKGAFVGKEALVKQFETLKRIINHDYADLADLPRMIRPIALTERGVARPGSKVLRGDSPAGVITSGTMVPMWVTKGEGLESVLTDQHRLRPICLGFVDSHIEEEDRVLVEVRGKATQGVVVPFHLRSDAPPYARPILYGHRAETKTGDGQDSGSRVKRLLQKAVNNHIWRQQSCINLIPSEMTLSPMVRRLSILDPAFRYAEHKNAKAFYDADIFYYQGTDFIGEVERLLVAELQAYLGCEEVETRVISGQMANMAVYSAMLDYLNRADRKREARRLRQVMCNHIGKGGHLSSQPMGALHDYVSIDPITERPAVVNFPVLPHNPYKIDVPATLKEIEICRPELIVLGKSMVIYREPIAEIARFLEDQRMTDTVLMVDMAHVLGLIGPHFQEPFKEGAHLVTGSTHKTYFGTQRGIVGCPFTEQDDRYELWETIQRRTFPGSVSNHHLGTLLGLLMAAYEMNHFKNVYQPKVIANAKAFARALSDCGLEPAGDPEMGYTQTHQVILPVGYGRGPEMATRLEENNIICNYQAVPDEEGFTASGALRMGVSEMTRFGMEAADFQEMTSLIRDVVVNNARIKDQVAGIRKRFLDMQFCFSDKEFNNLLQNLHQLV
ncbi:MAG: glycine cleavage system aminomethyltransferase GcvT [Deltaproteobacteria bacterium]|nr:glycine cleavage system aminomethyltransferase GcvT [Deltaproteobacteria bacterium]